MSSLFDRTFQYTIFEKGRGNLPLNAIINWLFYTLDKFIEIFLLSDQIHELIELVEKAE